MTDISESYASVREAAARLDFSLSYVHKLMKDGVLEHTRMGRQWIISIPSIDKFIKERNKK